MTGNILKAAELGQSIWCDYISRDLMNSGKLKDMINQGVGGVTSNPAIFRKAITESNAYDSLIFELSLSGLSSEEIYEELAIRDVRHAADIMRPVYDCSEARDGYVSLEVNPRLAHDVEGTVRDAKRFNEALDRPNVMIKIPATDEGYSAIEESVSAGININATLIFSQDHYEKVAEAYISGLEKLVASGGNPSRVRSVASLFISRVDTAIDVLLPETVKASLQGKIAIDNARVVYQKWKEKFSGQRWEKLAALGAVPQRVLWASTGTKNSKYKDTLYVDELIGPETVNTIPPATMEKFIDHGTVENRVEFDLEGADNRLLDLSIAGIDLSSICDFLREAGVQSFVDAFDSLVEGVSDKVK